MRILFICLCSLLLAGSAWGAGQDGAAISVHVTPYDPDPCAITGLTDATLNTSAQPANCGSGDQYLVYVLVCNGSDSLGIAGMEFGIDYAADDYTGIDVLSFTRCADLVFAEPGWPAAGTGALITWDAGNNCQNMMSEPFVPNTVIALGGAFRVSVYSPDVLEITPRPISGKAAVAGCIGGEVDITNPWGGPGGFGGGSISRLGIAGFCNSSGYSPCSLVIPVEPSTWGRIKRQFDR